MFTQIFLSEIISTAENGGQGTHFLISQILKGLTHSAMAQAHQSAFLLRSQIILVNCCIDLMFMKIYSFFCKAHNVLLNEYSFSTEDPGYDDGLKSFLKVNMSAGKQK